MSIRQPARLGATALLAAAIFAARLAAPGQAAAAAFRVTSTADMADATPGDGVCEANAGAGDCTLRAAIQESRWVFGHDDVSVPPGDYTLLIAGPDEDDGATGDLDISGDLALTCELTRDCRVTSANGDRCLAILPGSLVAIDGFTFSEGTANPGSAATSEYGGLVFMETAILNLSNSMLKTGTARYGGAVAAIGGSTLQVSDTTAQGCSALLGGGFYVADSSGTLNRVLVDTCAASGNGGGLACERARVNVGQAEIRGCTAGRGGAVSALSGSEIALEESLVTDNRAFLKGGAVSVDGGVLGISATRCELNNASEGGGIHVIAGRCDLLKSSLTNNMSSRGGGALLTGGEFRSLNSTIAYNKAAGFVDSLGGGIFLAGPAPSVAEITFTTFSGNSATNGGAIAIQAGTMTMTNTILANNIAAVLPEASAPDGALVSLGYNILGDPTGLPPSAITPEDIVGVDPMLGALDPGRGYSLGLPPGPLSPGLDAANPTACLDLDDLPLKNDQHAEVRPVDGDGDGDARCDVGALEWCGEDLDGNGVGDKCGCVPGDLGSIVVPPEPLIRAWRIQGFRHALLTWDDLRPVAGELTTYEVAGAGLDAMHATRTVDGPCLIIGLSDERFEDVFPAAEDVYYLVRGVNGCGPVATQGWGKDSLGNAHLACP